MLRLIDSLFLNRITMYRLTLYYLIVLIGVAMLGGFFGFIPYSPLDIGIQTATALIVGFIANYLFAKFFHAVTNIESVYITALILVLIIPVKFPMAFPFIALAAFLAMGSKYFVTIEKRHVFNPAAAAVLGISLLSPDHTAIWWVGSTFMAPFVLIGGLLLMRKIQRETMVTTFFVTYSLLVAASSIWYQGSVAAIFSTWKSSLLQSSLLFFGFVMFTEPLTSPTTKKLQKWYAYIVAVLFATPQLRLFSFAIAPEMALCIGNVISYFMSPNYRLALPLSWKKFIGPSGIFAFMPSQQLAFAPGQYMEWTLPHKNVDSRGNRRYFSIGSSPTEKELLLAVKFYNPSSSYKKTLVTMQQGDEIIAAQLAGDFTLPKKINTPLVFIAGGIGIVPFRSMVKYIIDKNLQANIILLYANRTKGEIVFADIFQEAQTHGIKTIYTLTDIDHVPQDWQGEKGYITGEMIQRTIPDYKTRTFYLSGPQLMVERYHETLTSIRVSRNHIKQDFFPGYSEK